MQKKTAGPRKNTRFIRRGQYSNDSRTDRLSSSRQFTACAGSFPAVSRPASASALVLPLPALGATLRTASHSVPPRSPREAVHPARTLLAATCGHLQALGLYAAGGYQSPDLGCMLPLFRSARVSSNSSQLETQASLLARPLAASVTELSALGVLQQTPVQRNKPARKKVLFRCRSEREGGRQGGRG